MYISLSSSRKKKRIQSLFINLNLPIVVCCNLHSAELTCLDLYIALNNEFYYGLNAKFIQKERVRSDSDQQKVKRKNDEKKIIDVKVFNLI